MSTCKTVKYTSQRNLLDPEVLPLNSIRTISKDRKLVSTLKSKRNLLTQLRWLNILSLISSTGIQLKKKKILFFFAKQLTKGKQIRKWQRSSIDHKISLSYLLYIYARKSGSKTERRRDVNILLALPLL